MKVGKKSSSPVEEVWNRDQASCDDDHDKIFCEELDGF